MNRIYRVVWSKVQQCWCVASEFARHSGKGGRALALVSLGALSGLFLGDAVAAGGSNYEKGIAGNGGLYVNDSTDSGCVFVHDTGVSGDQGWKYDGNNSNCKAGDRATQTGRVLFYGTGSQADGSNSLTLGNELYVNGGRIGLNNKIDGTNSLAIGNVASDALGNPMGTRAVAVDSVAIGNNAIASKQNAMALGTAAQALAQDSVALGAGSVAGTAAGVLGFIPNGGNPAQANAISATTSTLGAIAVGDAGSGKFRQITAVAAGTQDSDAVNVAQLRGVTEMPITFTGNAGSVEKKLGDTLAIEGAATTAGNYSGSNLKTEVDAYGNLQLQMADNPVFDSVTTGNTTMSTYGLTITGGPSVTMYGIDAGDHKIINVAPGDISDSSTDAVNGSQLNTTNQQVEQNSNIVNNLNYNINNGSIGPVQRSGTDQLSLIASGGDAYTPGNAQVLTNVAAGAVNSVSVDAINGSQLHETNQRVDANTTNITNLDGRVTNVEGDVTNLGAHIDNIYTTGTKYFHANSTGTDSSATGVDSVAIGMGAVSSHDGSVALGAGSVANGSTLGHQAYLVGGTATGEVNLGDRRVTGLSAGADDTDAVNVAQLKQVSSAATEGSVKYDLNGDSSINYNNITLGGTTYNSVTKTGGTKITNVARGENDSDAVNMSQLNETNTQVTNIDGRVTNVEGDVSNLGDHIDNIYATGTKYFHANSTGTDSSATGADSVAIGMGAVSSHDGSVALGAGSVANGSTLGHQAYLVGGTATGEVNLGDRRVTGLSAGADDTDAVNVAQLKKVTSASTEGSVKYDLNGDGSINYNNITLGGPTYNSVTKTGGTKITNVARGENDSDAVNMSQLNETNAQVTNIDGRVTTVEGSITSINNGGGIKYFHANSSKPDSVASGADAVAVGPSAQASGKGAIAVGNGASASADGSVALGQGASDNGRGAEHYTGKYSKAANASVGTVSVGNAATGETRTISNLADGKEATDAVNLRQLDGAVVESKQYTDNSISNINTKVANVTTNVSNLDNRVTHVEGDVSKVQNGTDGMFQVNNTSRLPKPKASGKDAVAGGAGAQAVGNNSTAIGSNAKAKGANSVAIGAKSVADRANSVSVGSAGNERQITNVAAGSAATDAVNVSQLQRSMGDISNSFYDYTDARYDALRHDLKKQDDILSSGIAGAMAMATLPQPYAPGASMATVGLGNFRGQGALAVGVSKITDNGKWVMKLQGSTTSQGETGVAVGVGYQW
ncbi:YadA-like family protein [Pseudomonas sp. NUPR-001]|uniref:YadA-like family protein n=1 Tax=Pseudomonas sp. NUPR-001 TaxID=3416058 RepID=UPI003F9B1CB3